MNGEFKKSDRILVIGVAALLAAAVPIGILGLIGLQHSADGLRAQVASLDAQTDAARTMASKLAQMQWDFALQAGGVGVALAGAVLAALAAWGTSRRRWPLAAVAAAVVYLVLDAAPAASSLPSFFFTLARHVIDSSQSVATAALEPLALARFAMAVLAAGFYLAIAWRLAPRLFYGLTCGSLGAAALFFNLWSPPPPNPVPIAHPLAKTWSDASGLSHTMADDILASFPGWTGGHTPMPKLDEQQVGADDYLNFRMQSPDKQYVAEVYITYNADAMSNIPHVPWVCMIQGGAFELAAPKRVDDVQVKEIPGSFPGREVSTNVLLFQPGPGRTGPDIFMFQTFRAGDVYEHDRDVARAIAAAGAHSQAGSFISQFQVRVVMPRSAAAENSMDRRSEAYRMGLSIMNIVVPLLDKEYYPDLHGPAAAAGVPPATPGGSEGG